MTALLVIIVLVIIGMAIWQMTKIYEFTQLDSSDSPIANDEDNKLNGNLMFAFLVFLYVMMLYGFYKWGKFVLPEAASDHGGDYDMLMLISFVIIFIVQFITQALLHYFAFKYKGKEGQKALYFADNNKLEFIWTVIPVIVLAGLILYGLFTWSNIMNINEDEGDPIIVELYAQQFNWTARYAGADNELGEANVRMIDIDKANVLGLDEADVYAEDDIITKELHLPVGRRVIFKMRSQDVLHSAYMPHFRAQMNCVPGMTTQFSFTPTITTEDMRMNPDVIAKVERTNKIRAERKAKGEDNSDPWEFDYILLCNKICGKSHYNMQMKIVVETEEEYNKWIAQQKTFKESVLVAQN